MENTHSLECQDEREEDGRYEQVDCHSTAVQLEDLQSRVLFESRWIFRLDSVEFLDSANDPPGRNPPDTEYLRVKVCVANEKSQINFKCSDIEKSFRQKFDK